MNPYYEYFNDYKNFKGVFPYSQLELRELEIAIVTCLKFRLKFYTPYDFLMIFFTYGIIFNHDTFGNESNGVSLCPVITSKNKHDIKHNELDFVNDKIVEEVYDFCQQLMVMILEGIYFNLFYTIRRCKLFGIFTISASLFLYYVYKSND